MPQLDKVTFLTQFFWLCIFYFGFYLLLVKHFLPRMARLLKLRQAKMSLSQGGFSLQEKSELQKTGDSLLLHGAKSSRNFFTTSLQNTSDWMASTVQQTNRSHFQSLHQAYILSLFQMGTLQNSIQMLHAKSVLSPRAHAAAGAIPQSGPAKESFYTETVANFLKA
jgi:hypothetical protein